MDSWSLGLRKGAGGGGRGVHWGAALSRLCVVAGVHTRDEAAWK